MSTIVNERYSIMSKVARTSAPSNASLQIVPDALAFHVDAQGNPTPSVINLTAVQQNMAGTIVWSAAGGTVKNMTQSAGSNIAKGTLAFADVPASGCTVTIQTTIAGQTFTNSLYIGKYTDGHDGVGTPGQNGQSVGTGFLFQWAPSKPSNPTGVGAFGWSQNNLTSYSVNNDGWSITPPANPNNPGWYLWVASKATSAALGTVSTNIDFTTGVGVSCYGNNGSNGAPGIKATIARAYAWGIGSAPSLAGTSTWNWANNAYDTVPTNWTSTRGNAPSKGYTLYEADVALLETAGAATSPINWVNASVVAVGYIGMDGSGGTGSQGASSVVAYTLVDGNSLNATPAYITTAIGALPVTGTWGETRAWTSQPSVPSAGQAVFMSMGVSDPSTGKVTWNLPMLSSLRVGSLSAISANLGQITGGSLNINNAAIIDSSGNATFTAITVKNSQGVVVLNSAGLTAAGAAPGTLNSDLTTSINNAAASAVWANVTGANKPADGATTDVTLVGRNCTIVGNTATKTGGTGGSWDSDVYSLESYLGAAYASAVATNTGAAVMFGLNTDPKSDSNYTSIDFGLMLNSDGKVYIYESGSNRGSTSYAVGDSVAVCCDGSTVYYLKNGVLLYVTDISGSSAAGSVFFFDSSFATSNASLKNIRFGPMSSNNWVDVGGAAKPADNATRDITLIGRNAKISGNSAYKTGGAANTWDTDVYSKDSFTGGAFASAVALDATSYVMFGLNSDPTTDSSYTSLDYAIYLDGSTSPNRVSVYESGAGIGSFGPWVAGDTFAVVYDGSSVRYMKNGVVFYTSVSAASKTPNQTLFFDSSIYTMNGGLGNIRLGPLTSNNWANIGGNNKPADGATVGATFGTNVYGQINQGNAAQYVSIPYLSVFAAKIGLIQTATGGARSQIKDDLISVMDTSGAVRVKIGNTNLGPT